MGRVRSSLLLVCVSALVLSTAPVAAAPTATRDSSPPGAAADGDRDGLSDDLEQLLADRSAAERIDVIVTLDGPGDADALQRAVGGFDVEREFTIIRGFAARMTIAQARALAQRPEVFRVERDFEVSITNDAANADFGTTAARADAGVTGADIEICVVDTGVDIGHEQFDTKLDASGNIPFHDAINGRTVAYDDHGHGTHVAATALGDGTGSTAASRYGGVAPGAALSAAKVLDANGSGTASQVIAGVEWCAGRPEADVISMSLGGAGSSDGKDSISQAVDEAVVTHGKVVVVAAGNSGDAPYTIGSPAAAAQAITVGAAAEWSSGATTDANASRGIHLAPWSSRGPTADDRTKPDITAPGVSITSAQHGTTAGYVTWSGTSMATPFTSGTVALMLANGTAPADAKTVLAATADDRGVAGQDDDWGHGLLDGYEAVVESGATLFPQHAFLSATVADDGVWRHSFEVTDLGVPIAATVLIDGAYSCSWWWLGTCLIAEWDGPDLDVRLLAPDGSTLDTSTCPLGCHSNSIGHQETIEVMPTTTGTYVLEVFPYDGDPNYGRGGPFTVDLSLGPAGGGTGSDPNTAPTASDVTVTTWEDTSVIVTLTGSDAEDCELGFSIVEAPDYGTLGAISDVDCDATLDTATITYTPAPDRHGTDSFTYRVTDGGGLSADATVTITVDPVNDPPNASFTYACTDLTCSFDGSGSRDPDGDPLTYSWTFGDGATATGATASHTYASGGTYTATLKVDDGAASDSVSDTITVSEPTDGITLSAAGYKMRGLQRVDLAWSGATSDGIDVYRDGVFLATTANDGAYTDAIDRRGGGSYAYQVCEAGTDACSNVATVDF